MTATFHGFQRIKVVAFPVTDLERANDLYSRVHEPPPNLDGDEQVGPIHRA